MLVKELFEEIIDASPLFQKRRESNLENDMITAHETIISTLTQHVEDKLAVATEKFNHEIQKYKFVVATLGLPKNLSVLKSLSMGISSKNDTLYRKTAAIFDRFEDDLPKIIKSYRYALYNISHAAEEQSEKLTGDKELAKKILINANVYNLQKETQLLTDFAYTRYVSGVR